MISVTYCSFDLDSYVALAMLLLCRQSPVLIHFSFAISVFCAVFTSVRMWCDEQTAAIDLFTTYK